MIHKIAGWIVPAMFRFILEVVQRGGGESMIY